MNTTTSHHSVSSGKHLICDLCNVQNAELMNSLADIRQLLDRLCIQYSFTVLGTLEHQFTPHGCSVVYLLAESHISVHTFPEKNYIAMDIYTCRDYPDNSVYSDIYGELVRAFGAEDKPPLIIDRGVNKNHGMLHGSM
jgi:S-adenosylmethionine decarboxylase proenzyme